MGAHRLGYGRGLPEQNVLAVGDVVSNQGRPVLDGRNGGNGIGGMVGGGLVPAADVANVGNLYRLPGRAGRGTRSGRAQGPG